MTTTKLISMDDDTLTETTQLRQVYFDGRETWCGLLLEANAVPHGSTSLSDSTPKPAGILFAVTGLKKGRGSWLGYFGFTKGPLCDHAVQNERTGHGGGILLGFVVEDKEEGDSDAWLRLPMAEGVWMAVEHKTDLPQPTKLLSHRKRNWGS